MGGFARVAAIALLTCALAAAAVTAPAPAVLAAPGLDPDVSFRAEWVSQIRRVVTAADQLTGVMNSAPESVVEGWVRSNRALKKRAAALEKVVERALGALDAEAPTALKLRRAGALSLTALVELLFSAANLQTTADLLEDIGGLSVLRAKSRLAETVPAVAIANWNKTVAEVNAAWTDLGITPAAKLDRGITVGQFLRTLLRRARANFASAGRKLRQADTLLGRPFQSKKGTKNKQVGKQLANPTNKIPSKKTPLTPPAPR